MKDYLGYQGKICVVTGAASGMGKATCEMLLDLGAKVYAMDIAEITLSVEKCIKVNLGDKASIDEAFQQVPDHIDRFFGIAGVSGVTTDFKTTMAINFLGHKYIIADYLTQRMEAGGAIALMGSLGGTGWLETREELNPLVDADGYEATMAVLDEMAVRVERKGYGNKAGLNGYFMSKRALTWYVKKMTAFFADRSIRLNIICPGSTQTQLTDQWASLLDAKAMQGQKETRYAQPSEMAGPIIFANSDMASYMSGQHIYIDYGQNAINEYTNPTRQFSLVTL